MNKWGKHFLGGKHQFVHGNLQGKANYSLVPVAVQNKTCWVVRALFTLLITFSMLNGISLFMENQQMTRNLSVRLY